MLPPGLEKYFWDTDPMALDEGRHKEFIKERLLELGDDEAIRWLVRRYGKGEIAATVVHSGALSRKTASLWSTYLGLKKEEVRCLRESSTPRPGR